MDDGREIDFRTAVLTPNVGEIPAGGNYVTMVR